MKIINIHEAKTHLSRLVEQAVNGDSFVIAKAGKPMVIVTPYQEEKPTIKKIGFMKNHLNVPDDFDRMGEDEIAALFGSDK